MMDAAPERPAATLSRLINGYRVSYAIHVAAKLGLADLLTAAPRSSDDLAAATGCHAPSLYRLLRALAAAGVFHEEADRSFRLTPVGEALRTDAPDSLSSWAVFIGEEYHQRMWGDLLHSVRTGENAFRHVYGTDVWTYRANHPELSATFDRAMISRTREVLAAVLDAYDFGRFGTIVDVAGGVGTVLAAILARNPRMQGVLFDQPHVLTNAPPLLREMGVADRCELAGGSFFEAVPAGGDAYILKSILHDWEDAECVEILRVCRRAMTDGAALLVIEAELGPPNERPQPKFLDLQMLIGPGGRERTEGEYATLFAASGFRLTSVTPSASGEAVFEGAPV